MPSEPIDVETWSRPLLPAALEVRLLKALARAVGVGLLAAAALGWLVLLTWHRESPGVAPGASRGATQVLVSNSVLGPVGGQIGDLLLTSLGAVVVVGLVLASLFSAELAASGRLRQARWKAVTAPVTILLLAGGAAALPVPAAWPMSQALGGVVGTVVLALVDAAASSVAARHSTWIAGAAMMAAGAALFTHVVIASVRDFVADAEGRGLPATDAPKRRDVDFGRVAVRRDRAEEPSFDRAEMVSLDAATVPRSQAFGPYEPSELKAVPLRRRRDGGMIAGGEVDRGRDRDRDRGEPDGVGAPYDREPGWRGADDDYDDADALADRRSHDVDLADPGDDPHELAASQDLARRLVRPQPDDTLSTGSTGASVASVVATLGSALARRPAQPTYRPPSLDLLRRTPGHRVGSDDLSQTVLRGTARLLLDVLESYGVRGTIRGLRSGPVVTTFEFEPAAGVRAQRLAGLDEDIARAMGAPSVRIATAVGRSAVEIELPNARRDQITVRDMLASDQYRRPGLVLPLAIGRTVTGEPVVLDLAHLPHVLVAGSSAARPPIALHAMLLSLVFRHGPETCRLLLIDPRLTDLSAHMGLPHLAMPIVSDPRRGLAALAWAAQQMDERTKQMATLGVRSLDVFNNRVRNARRLGERAGRTVQTGFDMATGRAIYERDTLDAEPLPRLVVVIAELAELMAVDALAVEHAVLRLARGGPQVGIHIIAATDHATDGVLTTAIRSALPARVCLKLLSKIDSRTVLGEAGAEHLLSDGDMLVHDGVGSIVRMHAAIAAIDDVEAVAAALRKSAGLEPLDDYPESIANADGDGRGFGTRAPAAAARGSTDELYESAVALVVRLRQPSAAMLQQRLRIDAHHARALLERMHRDGLLFDEE